MRAIRVNAPGGPEAMQLVDLPTPQPTAGKVLVRVEFAGVNFIDIYHRTGLYESHAPFALGVEGAGVVEAIGPGVTDLRVGDRVAWASARGSYATHLLVRAEHLVRLPEGIDTRKAAAVMLQGMTAHYLARSTYVLSSRDTCLVHAVAGGVGLLLCQIAKRAGARVIGTTSTEQKARVAHEAGADEVILYTAHDFEQETRRLTGGRGVDVVYDGVGRSTFDQSLRCLRPRGMMVSYGNASGPVAPFAPLVLSTLGSLYLTRPKLADYTATREELLMRAMDVLGAVARGELTVHVHDVLPLERAADAHRLLESRATSGKLLLVP